MNLKDVENICSRAPLKTKCLYYRPFGDRRTNLRSIYACYFFRDRRDGRTDGART